MSGNLRKSLEKKRTDLARRAAASLLDGQQSNIEDSIRTIEDYSKVLSIISSPRKWARVSAVATAAICIVIAWLLWGEKYWNNVVRIQVQSETIGAKLAESWRLPETVKFDSNSVRIEQVDFISIPVLGKKICGGNSRKNIAWLDVRGDHINLSDLFLEKDEEVKIERTDNGKFTFYAKGPEVRGSLQVSGNVHIKCGIRKRRNYTQVDTSVYIERRPWRLDFKTEKNKSVCMKIRGGLKNDWVIRDQWVSHLDFSRRKPDISERIFESTIIEGEIGLPQVSRERRLHAREGLELAGVHGRIVEMRVADSLFLLFEGNVKRIEVGTRGAKKNIAPSLVEYIYHNWRLPFLITFISFIWGILWSTRKLLFS